MPRVRLITDVAPSPSHTAGIMLEQLIEMLGKSFDWTTNVLVDDGLQNYEFSRHTSAAMASWTRKPQEWHPRNKPLNFILGNIVEIMSSRDINKFVSEIELHESRVRSNLIIIAIQGQSSYRIAKHLLEKGFPVSLIFWDPWEWWESAKSVPKSFYKVITEVHSLARNNGCHLFPTVEFGRSLNFPEDKMEVLYPFMPQFTGSKVNSKSPPEKTTSMVFLGQPYAGQELKTYFDYLDSLHWDINGSNVALHTYGKTAISDYPRIEHHGWLNYKDLNQEISKYDYALLPYPTSRNLDKVSRFSFPSKLAQYLSAGLNILYVGPLNSSVTDFFQKNGFKQEGVLLKAESESSHATYLFKFNLLRDKENQLYSNYFCFDAHKKVLQNWALKNNLVAGEWDSVQGELNSVTVSVRNLNYIGVKDPISLKIYNFLIKPRNLWNKVVNKLLSQYKKSSKKIIFIYQLVGKISRFNFIIKLIYLVSRKYIEIVKITMRF